MALGYLSEALGCRLGAGNLQPGLSQVRWRQRGMFLAALFILPFVVLDGALPNGKWVATLGAAWLAVLVLSGMLQRDGHRQSSLAGVALGVLVSAAATTGKILLTGGSRSPFFGLLLTLSPAVALVVPELPAATAIVGSLTLAAGVAIRFAEGRDLLDIGYWATLAGGVAGLSLCAACLARRQVAGQLAAERARRQALKNASEAELKRLALQRLTEAHRLAADISHGVNNPLAAIRANLYCLLEDLDAPAGERNEVLRDTADAVERIADTIGKLRRVGLESRGLDSADRSAHGTEGTR